MEALFTDLPVELIGTAFLAALIALLVGHLMGRSGNGRLRGQLQSLSAQLGRAESRAKEKDRTITRMRSEHDTVANLALSLPHVVRDMNRNDLDPAEVPRLIHQLANAIFQPGEFLLYGVRSRPNKPRELCLIEQVGFANIPESLRTIPMGEGQIGWVAQHELDMLTEDWTTLSRNESITVANNSASFKAEIIGPLVHHSRDRQQVLGVLCIGSLGIRPRDPKLMFQMVTNFASLALVNSWNMKKLRSMANHDGLTGLLNKRCFLKERAANLLVDCERKAKPFSAFIFDIDHFKNYNDTNGHPAGDDLLRQMGALIKEQLRPGDLACRYGGEEFVIAMPDTDREEACRLADKVREAVSDTEFAHRENQPLGFVSISGGVASFPKDGASITELIKHADEALYRSKKGGRNRVAAYKGVEIGDRPEQDLEQPFVVGPAEDGSMATDVELEATER